jgi:hypothetical protein
MPTALYFCTRLGDGVPVSSGKYRAILPPAVGSDLLAHKRDFQANSSQAQIADSSSRNAVNFSSACTVKRFPSSRCADQQPRLFARWDQSLRRSPHSNQLCEIVSDDFPILHLMSSVAPFVEQRG